MTASNWALAERTALGLKDNGVSAAMRRYLVIVFPVLAVVCTAVGALITWLVFGDDDGWLLHLKFGVMLSSLVTGITGFVYAHRRVSPMVKPERASVLMLLEPAEAKNIRKQATGRKTIDAQKVQVVRAAAIQMRPGLAMQLMLTPSWLMLFTAQMLSWTSLLFVGLYLLLIASFGVVIVLGIRDFRGMSKVLQSTEASSAQVSEGAPPD